jgi:hypothetical protein
MEVREAVGPDIPEGQVHLKDIVLRTVSEFAFQHEKTLLLSKSFKKTG